LFVRILHRTTRHGEEHGGDGEIVTGVEKGKKGVRNTGVTLAVLKDYMPNSLRLCV